MTQKDTTALLIIGGLLWFLYKRPVVSSGYRVVDPADLPPLPILTADPGPVPDPMEFMDGPLMY